MVLFFTGTGNSKLAAKILGARLDDEVVSLNDVIKQGKPLKASSEKPYIFAAPIYAWRLPRIIEELIENAELGGTKKVYFVVTMGSESGNCDKYCRRLCENKGMEYMGLRGVAMPSNYIAGEKMPGEAEISACLTSARAELETIGGVIAAGERLTKTDRTPVAGLKSGLINSLFNKFAVTSKGYVVSDACVSCGKCAEFCPVNNITMTDGRPVFDGRCVSCYGCLQRCPKQAINIGSKTRDRGRYVCPE